MSAILFTAGMASFLASLVVSFLALKGGVLDFPEARSLHARPTPRSGGLGLLAGAGAGALSILAAPVAADALAPLLAFTGACGLLGFCDDLNGLGGRQKFAVLCVLCLGLAAFEPVSWIPVTSQTGLVLPWVVGLLGSALFLFTVINAVNFMDGSDGMLAAVLIPAGAGLAVAGLVAGVTASAAAGALLAAGLAGLLVFNRPPAKLFAGDAGSLAAGALYAGGALIMAGKGFAGSLWLAPLFVLPVLADVLLTLARRARHRRLSIEAHSEHAFQRLIKAGWSHGQAALAYAGLTLVCVLAGLAAAQGPDWAPFAAFWSAVIVLSGLYAWAGRHAHGRGVEV